MNWNSVPLVAHVIFRLDYGGLENGLVNIINRMPAARVRHAIICLAGHSDFRWRITRADVAVYSLDKRLGKDLAVYVRLWRLLRQLRPDIVHTRNLGTIDLQWVALAAGVKIRIHGEHGWEAGDLYGTSRRSLIIRRASGPSIQRYIAVSKDIGRWLTTTVGIPTKKIVQIYNGVDTERLQPEGALPVDLPWRRESGDGIIVFGTIGRLTRVKNQAALLEAFAILLRQSQDGRLRLIIVGDGPLSSELEGKAGELGIADKVWLTGARDDIPALLRAMDVFVLPSLNEGISNTLLEAMSTGRPIVAARVGGNAELIESDRTGILYDPEDATGLPGSMSVYCKHPELRAAHGAAARRVAQERFAIAIMADRYADLYLTTAVA